MLSLIFRSTSASVASHVDSTCFPSAEDENKPRNLKLPSAICSSACLASTSQPALSGGEDFLSAAVTLRPRIHSRFSVEKSWVGCICMTPCHDLCEVPFVAIPRPLSRLRLRSGSEYQ